MTTERRCPHCNRYINSVDGFIYCDVASPLPDTDACPVRVAHRAATGAVGFVPLPTEEAYLDWLMGTFMMNPPVDQPLEPEIPLTPAEVPVEPGGGFFDQAVPAPEDESFVPPDGPPVETLVNPEPTIESTTVPQSTNEPSTLPEDSAVPVVDPEPAAPVGLEQAQP